KEEFPFVVFDEHRDPSFGVRALPPVRSAIRGTTRVVASGPPLKKSVKTHRPSAPDPKKSRRQTMVAAQVNAKAQTPPRASSWSEPYPENSAAAPSGVATPSAHNRAEYLTDS